MTKIAHLSDWHTTADGFVYQLEASHHIVRDDPDLILVTGDMLVNFSNFRGTIEGEIQEGHFQRMMGTLEYAWPGADIFCVRGNHDWNEYAWNGKVFDFNTFTYSIGKEVISGMRGMPPFNGHWNDEFTEEKLWMMCEQIPKHTTILLTHVPPFGVLDDANHNVRVADGQLAEARHIGSKSILKLVRKLPKLKAHCFGHVHERGRRLLSNNGVMFSNAATGLNYFEV